MKKLELVQELQKTVEDWADGCDHTHDEPEDCEACTEAMMLRVGTLTRNYFMHLRARKD